MTRSQAPVPAASPAAEAMLMGRVARRYYVRRESKKDIALNLGISRFKVARLLDEAVESGLVRIEIGSFGAIDIDLSTRLEEELGLHRAVAILDPGATPVAAPAELSSRQLAVAAADLALELVADGDVLGLPWSRTIHAMVHELDHLPRVEIVQLCGDQAVPGAVASAVEVANRAARLAGGPAHVFYAPLVADTPEAAVTIRRQGAVQDSLARAAGCTIAFVGIGGWSAGHSSIYDAVGEDDRRAVREQGVIGEIAGVFFGADGRPVRTTLTDRLVAVDDETLTAIPRVVGIASGAGKAAALQAAIHGGLVDGIVVDHDLGAALLG